VTVDAKVGSAATLASNGSSAAGEHARLGLSVRPLNPQERSEAGVSGGLLVEDAQGPAADAGIQAGDVVLSVDGTAVQSADQLRKIVDSHAKQVALLIQRGQDRIFVPVDLG
jgi:serine protease Do